VSDKRAVSGQNVRAEKRFGQHFLTNPRVVGRIADAVGLAKDERVVEVGPGTGVLTRALLERGAIVYAIELDERFWPVLEALGREFPGQLEVLRGDALEMDWNGLLCGGLVKVVGNLPYNVGTEIVVKLITLPKPPKDMVFMLQKEVVRRICARPDVKEDRADWGRLAVLCDLLCERHDMFDVGPGNFNPPPKVMSSVVRLTPMPAPRYAVDMAKLDVVLRAIFGQRRKMLRGVLKGLISEETLVGLGIDPTWRGEVLDTRQICAMARTLGK
jgi:16S rRNA (adenine1518-N6/adenine1519-N6)-dimethyltransferase